MGCFLFCCGLKNHGWVACRWLLLLLLGSAPVTVLAAQLQVQVDGYNNGKIVVSGQGECRSECRLLMPQGVASLFAVPDSGYRFLGWQGACEDTTGPLCTLAPGLDRKVRARFAKMAEVSGPIKALLLVHEPGAQAWVWNEFARRHFGNRCPLVYGGVLLEEDAINPKNQVHCYRVVLGYYTRFFQALKHQASTRSKGPHKTGLSSHYVAYEINAAMLGIGNRHPESGVVVVAHGLSDAVAATVSRLDTETGSHLVWLLRLDAADRQNTLGGFVREGGIRAAQPDQNRQLSKALSVLLPDWW